VLDGRERVVEAGVEEQHRELVSAEPGDHVRVPERRAREPKSPAVATASGRTVPSTAAASSLRR
jgi:hypothetical protein